MKLRNKKTGEIVEVITGDTFEKGGIQIRSLNRNPQIVRYYASLAELIEEWEDYEEPKEFWYINEFGTPTKADFVGRETLYDKCRKNFGNYFETEEEAEKAVEKLKAFKRLKDEGFRFEGWTIDDGLRVSVCTNLDSDGIYDEHRKEVKKGLDACFGGEE